MGAFFFFPFKKVANLGYFLLCIIYVDYFIWNSLIFYFKFLQFYNKYLI